MSIRGKKATTANMHDILEKEYNENNPTNSEKVVFALDIGTRSVVGIVGMKEENIFRIIDVEILQHRSRAMRDGQIHDIDQVAEAVEIVKEKLESRLGFSLEKVSIAAAGRSLKTCSAKVENIIDSTYTITQEVVDSLELKGIQMAHSKLQEENHEDYSSYYCIGHTVINYYLNGYVMSNLIGHKGKEICADVLATFLPHTVVDSLYAVMEKVGLIVSNLTLEPIAAINVAIPEDVRLLNVALVDIGAGTSDIAITKEGSVIAYDMCAIAGDKITEKIAKHYLLNFSTAEKVKIEASSNKTVEFEDIMGMKIKVSSQEIIEVIDPAVDELAEIISEKIIISNGKSPNAIFCIGGGSKTPLFIEMLARKLEIPIERVGIRGINTLKNIKFSNNKLDGPDAITPIGIAVTGLEKSGNDFLYVTVNDNKISLYNTGKVTVGDALVASGFIPEKLIPRRGKSLVFMLNGKKKTVKGDFGNLAQIFINSNGASINTIIKNGDKISVISAEDGKDASIFVKDFVENKSIKTITFNNNQLIISANALLNGSPVAFDTEIKADDNLHIQEINNISDLIRICEIDADNSEIIVNSQKEPSEYVISDGDVIITTYKKDTVFNQTVELDKPISVKQTNNSKKDIVVHVNGETIKLEGKTEYILVDIFNHFDVNKYIVNGRIVIKINNHLASYTSVIKNNDNIEISWI